ncbi:protein kinase [Marinilabiliaceae bacterium ANBcel2]|nr:protein kinase [Marinilabiliaceae bacterium ANBcel2]
MEKQKESFNNSMGEEFFIGKILSTGKFGEVKEAFKCNSNKKYILKPIKSDSLILSLLNKEETNYNLYKKSNKVIENHNLNIFDLFKSEPIVHNNQTYILREYIEGTTFKELITKKRGRLKKAGLKYVQEAFCNILTQLELLHKNNLLHCDIKPSNIIAAHEHNEDPSCWDPKKCTLIDFEQMIKLPADNSLRRPFSLGYSAPEQLLNFNHLLSPASDLFALGVTLYESITFKKAFNYYNPEMLMHIQLNLPLKKESNRLSPQLFSIIEKATAKQPFRIPPRRMAVQEINNTLLNGIAKRYSSVTEFKNELIKCNCSIIKKRSLNNFLKRLF